MFINDTLAFFNKDEYDLILCRPDKEELCVINEYKSEELHLFLKEIDEFQFEINKYTEDKLTHENVVNKYYNLMLKKYLVLLLNKKTNKKHYFIIDEVNENTEKNSKVIRTYSLEFIFNNLDFPLLPNGNGTFQLYHDKNDKVYIGEGILNILENVTGWKLAYVSDKAKNDYIKQDKINILKQSRKFRIMDSDGNTKINTYIRDSIMKAFNVLIFFDTDKEEIHVYSEDELNQFEDLYFSEDNYIKYVQDNITDNAITTMLHIYGHENMSVNEINPLGTDYIENYDYFRNNKYMSENLIDKFNKYDEFLVEKHKEFKKLLGKINMIDNYLSKLNIKLNTLKTELTIAENEQSSAIAYGEVNLEKYSINIKNKQIEIDNCNELIKNQNLIRDGFNANIREIGKSIRKENFFNKQDLKTIQKITSEDIWSNENIFKKEDLMYHGQKALKDLSVPTIEFNVEITDIVRDLEFKDINKIKLGKKVLIHIPDKNIEVYLTIIEIIVNENSTKLTLSNKQIKEEVSSYLSGSLANTQKTNNIVTKKKFIWDLAETTSKTISEMRNNNLDAARQAIVAGENEQIRMDNRGIGLSDSNNPNEQLAMTHNVLAMTIDNWQTSSVGVTPHGIIADKLIGRMILGENLNIQNKNNSMKIDENGIKIHSNCFIVEGGIPDEMIPSAKNWNKIEKNLTDLVNDKTKQLDIGLNKLSNGLDAYLGDGYVTAGEANVLETTFNDIKEENKKLNIFASELKIIDELNNYNNIFNKISYELSNWIGLEVYPVEIEEMDRFRIKKYMSELTSSKTILLNKINEVLAKNAEKNAKEYADTQVKQVDKVVKNLESDLNKFSDDGFLTKDEANSLEIQLNQLESESKDLIELGKSLKISNEVNAYMSSLKDLKDILNLYLKQNKYPIEITQLDRERIQTEFKNVQSYKTILSNKINQILNNNAVQEAKTYTNTKFQILDNEILLRAKQVDLDKLSNRVQTAEIKLQPDNITSTVMNSFRYQNENKELQQRLSVAEQKITPDGITNMIKTSQYMKEIDSNLGNLKERMNKTDTQLNVMKDKISSSVSQEDIMKIFENENLLLASGYLQDEQEAFKYWYKEDQAVESQLKIYTSSNSNYKGMGVDIKRCSDYGICRLVNTSLKEKGFKFNVNKKYCLFGKIQASKNVDCINITVSDLSNNNNLYEKIYIESDEFIDFKYVFEPKFLKDNLIKFSITFNQPQSNSYVWIPYVKLCEIQDNTDIDKLIWTEASENKNLQYINKAKSEINQLKDRISLSVSKTEINKTIIETNRKDKNLIINSGDVKDNDFSYWKILMGGGATGDKYLRRFYTSTYSGIGGKVNNLNNGWYILTNTSLKEKGFKFNVNKKYCLFGKIDTEKDCSINIQIANDNNTNRVVQKRYNVTKDYYCDFEIIFEPKIEGDENNIRFQIETDDVKFWIPYVKLCEYTESENVWTPAPEDIGLDKVSKDSVIASINMTPEKIKLDANKIDLTGLVTIRDLKNQGSVEINGGNIKGGTMTLGGIDNGNGRIIVDDSRGNEVLNMDKDGIKITMRYYQGDSSYVEALRIQDAFGHRLLSINSEGYFIFGGHILIGSLQTGFVTVSPDQIQFSNRTMLSAAKYPGLLDINHVAIGNGTEVNHVQQINYRLGISGVKIHNGQGNGGYGAIYGSTKNAITQTEHYGEQVTYADESPNHVFNDAESGYLNKDGYCLVAFDPIYIETTTSKHGDYIVMLTGWNDCNPCIYVQSSNYFIIKGKPFGKFNYIVRCERKGMERLRWNEADIYN